MRDSPAPSMPKPFFVLARMTVGRAISQPPAPFHVTPRGFAGPSLLAMILFEKFGQHQPLNLRSQHLGRPGRFGIHNDLSGI